MVIILREKLIGIKIAPLKGKMEREKLGPSKAIFFYLLKKTYNTISMTLSYLGKMIVGKKVPIN